MIEPSLPAQTKKSRGWLLASIILVLLLIGGLIVLLSHPQWLKKIADAVSAKMRGATTLSVSNTPIATTTQPVLANGTSTSSEIPPRPEISSLLSEPTARILTREADFNNDGMSDVAFIVIGNAESKGGEVDPNAFNAMVGILSYVTAEGRWSLIYQEAVGGVNGSDAAVLFEITDLNDDKHPEITYSLDLAGSGHINEWAMLSWDGTTIQKIDTTAFAYGSYGQNGHNRITLAPGHLIEEAFPIYLTNDPNCCATGGTQKLFFRFNGTALKLDHAERTK